MRQTTSATAGPTPIAPAELPRPTAALDAITLRLHRLRKPAGARPLAANERNEHGLGSSRRPGPRCWPPRGAADRRRWRSVCHDARDGSNTHTAVSTRLRAVRKSRCARKMMEWCGVGELEMAPGVPGASFRSSRSHNRALGAHLDH